MKIIINGKEEFRVPENAKTLIDILEILIDYLSNNNLGLVKLRVNEQNVYPGESLKAIQNMEISNIHTLEITATPILQLLQDSISELERYTPELSNICYGIAELFQSENPSEGLGPFQRLTEIWGEIKNREAVIVNSLSKYLKNQESSIVGEIVEHHRELNQYLDEAYKALSNEDMVSLSDILQYELAPRAEKELEIVNLLRKLVESIIITEG